MQDSQQETDTNATVEGMDTERVSNAETLFKENILYGLLVSLPATHSKKLENCCKANRSLNSVVWVGPNTCF